MKWLKRFAKDGGQIIHLTMYGEPYDVVVPEIPRDSPIAIVVGGAKVPSEIYKIANFNVAVGHQPHSEVAALALFMAEYMGGVAGSEHFSGAKLEIKPHPSGKVVIDHTEDSDSS